MHERLHKLGKGTVGSRRCEVALNEVLIEVNNAKVTNIALGRLVSFQNGLRQLDPLRPNKPFYISMAALWRCDQFSKWENSKEKVPTKVYSLVRNCMTAFYRDMLKEFKDGRCKAGEVA